MTLTDRQLPAPPAWPFLLVCALSAILIDGGTFHRGHTGDSLVPVLVSLQHWTPFMWYQDRLGMLVPLLAIPFRHPLVNLLVQQALDIFSVLAACVLLPRYVLRDRTYPMIGMMGAAAFLVLAPMGYRFNFCSNNLHGTWLVLGLSGLLLLEPRPEGSIPRGRRLGALGLMFLTHWAYFPAFLLLGPLAVGRYLLLGRCLPARRWFGLRGDAELTASLIVIAGGLAGGELLQWWVPTPHSNMGLLPLDEWPNAWAEFAATTWAALAPHYWPWTLVGAAAGGLLLLAVPAMRRQAGYAGRAALLLAGVGVTWFLVLGTSAWLKNQDYDDRYSQPAIFVVQAALTALALAPVTAALGHRPRQVLYFLTAPLLLLAAFTSYGLPSLAGVRADLDRDWGRGTEDIVAERCTHIAGGYWKVWPMVFHTNLVLFERDANRMVWGITFRSRPTEPQWRQVRPEDVCVAVPAGDGEEAAEWLAEYGFPPLKVVAKRPLVQILRPRHP